MLSKGPDELSENNELKDDELSGSDCMYTVQHYDVERI